MDSEGSRLQVLREGSPVLRVANSFKKKIEVTCPEGLHLTSKFSNEGAHFLKRFDGGFRSDDGGQKKSEQMGDGRSNGERESDASLSPKFSQIETESCSTLRISQITQIVYLLESKATRKRSSWPFFRRPFFFRTAEGRRHLTSNSLLLPSLFLFHHATLHPSSSQPPPLLFPSHSSVLRSLSSLSKLVSLSRSSKLLLLSSFQG